MLFFVVAFLIEFWRDLEAKIESKIEENMIANALGENYENVHSAHAKITFLMFRQLPNP